MIKVKKLQGRSTQPKGSLWFHLEENFIINDLKLKMAPGGLDLKRILSNRKLKGYSFFELIKYR